MFTTSHLHPMLVHFPIALVMIGFLSELIFLFMRKEICFMKMGFYLLVVGTLGALATWLSGSLFTAEMSGAAGTVREFHALFATLTVGLLLTTLLLRSFILWKKTENKRLSQLAFLMYALAAISVSITGFLGGTLVYNYMMPL